VLKYVRRETHQSLLNLRAIETIINKSIFERLWNVSTEAEKQAVTLFIGERRKSSILRWIRNHRTLDLEELSVIRLKEIGQQHSIRNWCRLTRLELIRALKDFRGKEKDKEKDKE